MTSWVTRYSALRSIVGLKEHVLKLRKLNLETGERKSGVTVHFDVNEFYVRFSSEG